MMMSESKLRKANEKIADGVTSGFKKMSDTVVGNYTKVEDKFVDAFLVHDGETTQEAKNRLKAEEQERKVQHEQRKQELHEKNQHHKKY